MSSGAGLPRVGSPLNPVKDSPFAGNNKPSNTGFSFDSGNFTVEQSIYSGGNLFFAANPVFTPIAARGNCLEIVVQSLYLSQAYSNTIIPTNQFFRWAPMGIALNRSIIDAGSTLTIGPQTIAYNRKTSYDSIPILVPDSVVMTGSYQASSFPSATGRTASIPLSATGLYSSRGSVGVRINNQVFSQVLLETWFDTASPWGVGTPINGGGSITATDQFRYPVATVCWRSWFDPNPPTRIPIEYF